MPDIVNVLVNMTNVEISVYAHLPQDLGLVSGTGPNDGRHVHGWSKPERWSATAAGNASP